MRTNNSNGRFHYNNVIMGTMASQITNLTIVYSTVYSGADQRKHETSASLNFVWGIHRGPLNSPHKWPVTWKIFPFDDVIMVKMSYLRASFSVGTVENLCTTGCHPRKQRNIRRRPPKKKIHIDARDSGLKSVRDLSVMIGMDEALLGLGLAQGIRKNWVSDMERVLWRLFL